MSKKFISAALTATTAVWLSGAMLLIPTAQAQGTDALQAQINALLGQIAQLQAQLGSSGGSTGSSYNFTRDLTVGSKGDDVKALQQFLNGHGALVAGGGGAGSPGNESTYFGSLTKAALAQWQGTRGITPSVGYFGPKTRAAIAAMAGGGGGGSYPPPVTPPVTPPNSGLAISLAAGSPTGAAIGGAGQIKVGKFNFTASNSSGVTITGLTFKKVGVLSDSNISNLYLADSATGEIVAQYQSLTQGVATFSGLALNVAAGQTWVGELRMDLSSSVTAGQTIAWQLTSATTASGATVTGNPITNALSVTTVSNPSIATLAMAEILPGTSADMTVDAGTSAVLVSSWTATVGNSAVNLTNMQFAFVGSANPADVKNIHLKVNGTDVATLAQASTNTNFNFLSNPVKLVTGQSVVEIYADVLGSPNRSFRFSLLQPYRVAATDTQYNTGISPTITNGTKNVAINQGQITVSLASDTPTGPIANGASNQTIAKFRVYAAGEPVKVKYLRAQITGTGTGANSWSTTTLAVFTDDIQNIKLIDDAGGQVGNTISTIGATTNSGDCSVGGAGTIICRFGVSASPINYIVPANTTRDISLVVDVLTTNDLTAIKGELLSDTSNLEGQISYQAANSGAVAGATRSVTTVPLALVANSAFAAPTYVVGSTGAKIASFVISASAAQGARINSLTFDKDLFALDLQNMKVMVGSTQFGSTRGTLSATAAETSLAFSGATPIQVPTGGSVVVDVYADILTGSADEATVFDLSGWSAIGNVSNSSIEFPAAVTGQSVTISSGPTLTVAVGSDTSPAKQVVMNSTGNSLFTMRLTANNVEDVRVTAITLEDTVAGATSTGVASFGNMYLYDGTTVLAGPLSISMAGFSSGSLAFSLGAGVIVPKNGSKTLLLKGDVPSYDSGGAVSGSTHNFRLLDSATSSVTALGASSNGTATVTGTPNSNTSTVYRTKVSLSSALIGAATSRTRTAVDDIATLNFSANSSYQALLNSVTIKFQGQAVSNGTAFSVDLIDANTNVALGSAASAVSCTGVGNSCSVTFSPIFTIDAGTMKQAKVRVNSSVFYNAASQSEGLSILVSGTGDVLISDGTTGGAAIPLESLVVPFTVANVSYE